MSDETLKLIEHLKIKRAMKTEKVNASLKISCNVECPKCENYFDLFEMQSLTEDGYIHRELLGERYGKKDWGEIVQCPKCKEKITIGDVEW